MKKLTFVIKINIFLLLAVITACGKITEKPFGKQISEKDSNYVLNSDYQSIIEAVDNMNGLFGKNYKKWTPSPSVISTS